jgi:drug/metabolite transporter (DMT)-like permease
MTYGQAAGLIGFACLLATGQALFKMSAPSADQQVNAIGWAIILLKQPSFWAAISLYGCATLLWVYLLQSVPLSRAYPFAALGFVIVPVLAVGLFGERLTPTYIAGAALIVAGIIVTARG